METIKKKTRARDTVARWNSCGFDVGLVPTMGALHQGHLSLVEASLSECDKTVVSIFLNPTQFGRDEDLDQYPRQTETDLRILKQMGVDMAFTPAKEEMYQENFCTWVVQEYLTEKLCGAFRPDHFRGVCTVVAKLFNTIQAKCAFFGRKDFQQAAVIKRMIRDLDIPITVRVMPTVREKDGLALSSRNRYLSKKERNSTACLHKALIAAREGFQSGVKDIDILLGLMRERLNKSGGIIKPQYTEIVAPDTLNRPETPSSSDIAAIAAFAGDTRLIDNMPLGGKNRDIYLNQAGNERV